MNIPEILVANGTGALLVIYMFLLRVRTSETDKYRAKLYDAMLVITLTAQITETLSFLLDGHMFFGCRFLLYLTNTICASATVLVGYIWCLFVDYRIFQSLKRLKKKRIQLGIPVLLVEVLVLLNLFIPGWMFRFSSHNVYTRGTFSLLIYILLMGCFLESIYTVHIFEKKFGSVKFFPVVYYMFPCIIGATIQAIFYGIATGWLSVSLAFMLVHMQLQSFNTFIDEMSGLYNRKYLNYYLHKMEETENAKYFGIMLDVNDFKSINDTYGHLMGDQAIKEIGHILTHAIPSNAIAMRMAGDEFMVFVETGLQEEAEKCQARIEKRVQHFNDTTDLPFYLSFSYGVAKYDGQELRDFLAEMDEKMYNEKKVNLGLK